MSDPVERSDELDRQILAIPADRVFTKRTVIAGFVILCSLLAAILGGIVAITTDTNQAVERQVAPLQGRNADLEEANEDLEATLDIAVDEVIRLATLVQELGGDPGQIRIEPPD